MAQSDSTRYQPQPFGATFIAPDPAARPEAEAAVALEWQVGDVILDTYEVKEIF